MEREEIEESLRHISGRTSVYYRNLVTGATIGIREELPMMAASVIKIPILVEAFHQIRTGEHTKNEIYVLQEGDKRPSCGCLNRMHAGLSVTYEDLCNLMIILSDNSATNILIGLLGGMDRINRDLREMGYETLQVNRLSRIPRGCLQQWGWLWMPLGGTRLLRGASACHRRRDC